MASLLDLPDHVISRIIRKNKLNLARGGIPSDSWLYAEVTCSLKYYSLCDRFRQLALQFFCSNAYVLCSSNFGRPKYSLCNGMPAHDIAVANNTKYTKSVYLDVSYEFILNGTASDVLSRVQCKNSGFTNAVSITVDMSVGDTYNVPDDIACTENVNKFINALNHVFPNAAECSLHSTNHIEMFDQVASSHYDAIVAGLFKQKSKISCCINNETFSIRTLPTIPNLTHLEIKNSSGILLLVELARQNCLTLRELHFNCVDRVYFRNVVGLFSDNELRYPCLVRLLFVNRPSRPIFPLSLTRRDLFPSLEDLYFCDNSPLDIGCILAANHKQLQRLHMNVNNSTMTELAASKIFIKNGLPKAKSIRLYVDLNDVKDNTEQCEQLCNNILCMAPQVETLSIVMTTPLDFPVLQSAFANMSSLPSLTDLSISGTLISMAHLIGILKQTPCLTNIEFSPGALFESSEKVNHHDNIDANCVREFCKSNGIVAAYLKFALLIYNHSRNSGSIPHYALLLALMCPKLRDICYSVPFSQFDKACSKLIDRPAFSPFKKVLKGVCLRNGDFVHGLD